MADNKIAYRKLKDSLFRIAVVFFALITTLPLIFILFYILKQGIQSINWHFLVTLPKPVGESGGGIANALVGTAIIVVMSSILAIPLGIGAGIYLSEYKNSSLADWARSSLEVLNGTPSIVLGIMAYLIVVKPFGGFSAFSGSVALAFMMLPVVIRTTEETLKLMPESLKEAALALGTPYYRVILKVILPSGASGIITGIMLSVARIAGETAPLLFTAFGSPYMNTDIFKPTSSLPLLIFNYATSPYNDWHKLAWGASLILVLVILLLNIFSKLAVKKWKVQF